MAAFEEVKNSLTGLEVKRLEQSAEEVPVRIGQAVALESDSSGFQSSLPPKGQVPSG
jgi:hypothetical protein